MSATIEVTFDPRDLPEWAQRDQDIVAQCRKNLAFRVQVCQAESEQARIVLRREACRLIEGRHL